MIKKQATMLLGDLEIRVINDDGKIVMKVGYADMTVESANSIHFVMNAKQFLDLRTLMLAMD